MDINDTAILSMYRQLVAHITIFQPLWDGHLSIFVTLTDTKFLFFTHREVGIYVSIPLTDTELLFFVHHEVVIYVYIALPDTDDGIIIRWSLRRRGVRGSHWRCFTILLSSWARGVRRIRGVNLIIIGCPKTMWEMMTPFHFLIKGIAQVP